MSRRPRRRIHPTPASRGETDAPLVPDLGHSGRTTERGPRRPDPFELELMEDSE